MSVLPLLRNAYLWTARRSLTLSTNQTQGAQPYLTAVPVHIESNTANAYQTLPDAAFKAAYYAVVASGTDIAEGDYVISVTTDKAGLKPWPMENPTGAGVPGASNFLWVVTYKRETAAGLLPSREVWIDREQTGGPAHL